MAKKIDDLNFWKQRIETAVKPHYSVYVIHEPGWKKILDEHTKIINEVIPRHSNVLDAGCGYGRMSEVFPADSFTYVGIDFSPDFIAKANQYYPERHFAVRNLKDIPSVEDKFDWAICVSIKKMVIDNLGEEEWKKMERSIKSVAKNILVLEYETPDIYEII